MPEDPQGENVPRDFYVPKKPVEQVAQENAERELNAAQILIVAEVVADFEELFDEARDIVNINPESKISLEAQMAGMLFARAWAEKKFKKYTDMQKVKTDSVNAQLEVK